MRRHQSFRQEDLFDVRQDVAAIFESVKIRDRPPESFQMGQVHDGGVPEPRMGGGGQRRNKGKAHVILTIWLFSVELLTIVLDRDRNGKEL